MALLEVKHLKKTYTTRFGGTKVEALKDVEFSVEKGEYVAIMGESGSGKTTLLNILAALDRPTGGKVLLDGKDMAAVPDSRMAAYRRDNLGFVFQDFNLLDTFSLKDNIYPPMVLARKNYKEMEERLIRDRLAKITANKTLVLITHRPGAFPLSSRSFFYPPALHNGDRKPAP